MTRLVYPSRSPCGGVFLLAESGLLRVPLCTTAPGDDRVLAE